MNTNVKLVKFHRKCKKEFTELLKVFNILFYGFGNKKNILSELFTKSFLYDMYYYSMKDVLIDLNSRFGLQENSIFNIDKILSKKKSHTTLIFIDFNFENAKLIKNLSYFKLVLTLERIDMPLIEKNMIDLNLVMRDLTTYEPYEIDNLMISDVTIDEYVNVVKNVGKNSKFVFLCLIGLSSNIVTLNDLWEKIRRPLLLVNKNDMIKLLTEFLDHKLIKIDDEHVIKILISSKYWDVLADQCKT